MQQYSGTKFTVIRVVRFENVTNREKEEKKDVRACDEDKKKPNEYECIDIQEESKECIICTDEKFTDEMVQGMACLHSICVSCSSKIDKCPFCRADFFFVQKEEAKEEESKDVQENAFVSRSSRSSWMSMFYGVNRVSYLYLGMSDDFMPRMDDREYIEEIAKRERGNHARFISREEMCNNINITDYSLKTFTGEYMFYPDQLSKMYNEFKALGRTHITTGDIGLGKTVRIDSQIIITPFFTFALEKEAISYNWRIAHNIRSEFPFCELMPFLITNTNSTLDVIECVHKINENTKIVITIAGTQTENNVSFVTSAFIFRNNKSFRMKKNPIFIGLNL
jgi:hypothetical protein